MNSSLVNWLPWSVLKISGLPFLSASSRASTQKPAQGVGQPPGEHIPAVPVDDGNQVQESSGHGDVGDVRRPDLVWPCYLHATQQVGVDFVARCRLTGPGAPVDGLKPHCSHQSPDTFPVYPLALTLQPCGHLACPVKRRGQVLTVDQLHESEILFTNSFRLVVQAGAADIQQGALTRH